MKNEVNKIQCTVERTNAVRRKHSWHLKFKYKYPYSQARTNEILCAFVSVTPTKAHIHTHIPHNLIEENPSENILMALAIVLHSLFL